MNLDEKIRMARQLETLGVDVIEAGFPIASQGDFEAVQAIAKAVGTVQVAGLCRAVIGDIDRCWEAVKEAKNPRIHTFLATSEIHMKHKLGKTADEVIVMIDKAVRHARQYTDNVEFSAKTLPVPTGISWSRCPRWPLRLGPRWSISPIPWDIPSPSNTTS